MPLTEDERVALVGAFMAILGEVLMLHRGTVSTLGRAGVIITEQFERELKQWTDDPDHQDQVGQETLRRLAPLLGAILSATWAKRSNRSNSFVKSAMARSVYPQLLIKEQSGSGDVAGRRTPLYSPRSWSTGLVRRWRSACRSACSRSDAISRGTSHRPGPYLIPFRLCA
jgi:hypothetical protein